MQPIDPAIFKAYDIRGLYPGQFNEDAAYRIARAFAQKLKPSVTVLGRDMRVSSPSLVKAVSRGLMDEGSDIILIGMTTSPMFYYSVNAFNADAGITVTASHNPEGYNGLKMTGPKAVPSIDTVSNQELGQIADANQFQPPSHPGSIREEVCPIDGYVKAVRKASGLESFGGLKIVVDTGSGMEGIILPTLFKDADCEVTPLYWEPDGTFPHHEANPIKEDTLADLKRKVRDLNANLGIAYDGDGDRVGFVDEKSCHIPGDIITALIAKRVLKDHPGGTVIYDVRSSWAVKEEIEKAGGKPLMWKVGHAFIKEKMREVGAVFAGELSSHYYFSDFFTTDNGDLAMLKVIQAMLDEGKSLSELTKSIMRYSHSPEISFSVPNVEASIQTVRNQYHGGCTTELDGLTVEYPDWWFNVRASHTEPLLRLNVEARTKEMMEEKVHELLKTIRGTDIIPPEDTIPWCLAA